MTRHAQDSDKSEGTQAASTDTGKHRNAAPSQPKNAPERIPGQNIPLDQRTSPSKVTSNKPSAGTKRDHVDSDDSYVSGNTTGAGDFMAPGQKHPMSNTELPQDKEAD
ncbi:hypothetical protein [Dyella sp.]|uniref:hypothetical protein n=1 Tax=Dyella sp. TaxID=1869338 RepID=UPI002ED460A0